MKTVCIFHEDCMDGAAAAAVVRHKFRDVELMPADHGEPVPPGLHGKKVFIVDFSFPAERLQEIKKAAAELHWFDHHKTSIPIRDRLGYGIIEMEESGASLTWKQLFPNQEVPKIIQYVRDKDIWLWQLPDSREVSADMRETEGIFNPTHAVWETWLAGVSTAEWQGMIERGRRSRRLQRDQMLKAAAKGFVIELDGSRALAVNWTEDASDLGEYIYSELGYDVALTFHYNGRDWAFSLRSAKVDCSQIALKRGGGGHRGAAGFRTPDIAWVFASQTGKIKG